MRCEEYIGQAVKKYDKVLLMTDDCEMELTPEEAEKIDLADKKILILSTGQRGPGSMNVAFERISEEFSSQLRSLYYTYEFADNFVLLDNSRLYAGIFNLVRTGILTSEEAWRGLLG